LRSTRHLTLTDAGETLLIRARQILDSLVDAQQELASMKGEVTGVLRVACYPTFGKRYVLPVMAKLSRQYPELSLDLDLTERLADPVAERLDVVIRIGEMADSTLIASKIATQIRVLCASPAYLENTGVPASLDEIVSHRLIDKLHGADLLCWSSVIGHPAKENTTYPCLAAMISRQCVRRRLKGWVLRSCRTGWREMTLTAARSSSSSRNWTSNRICPQESMRYAHYVTRLPESRCFSTHCVSSSDTLQNGQRVAVSHEEQLTLRTCTPKGRRHDPPVGQRDFLFRAYSCWSPLLWFSSVYLTGGRTALLHQKRKILRIDRC
jgi:DNA-binding transcriptional LysR family regulator